MVLGTRGGAAFRICPNSSEFALIWDIFGRLRPCLAIVDQEWGEINGIWPTTTNFGPDSAELGVISTKVGPHGQQDWYVVTADRDVQDLRCGLASEDCCHYRRSWHRGAEAPFVGCFGSEFAGLAPDSDRWSEVVGTRPAWCESQFGACHQSGDSPWHCCAHGGEQQFSGLM